MGTTLGHKYRWHAATENIAGMQLPKYRWHATTGVAHDNWSCSIQPEIFTHQNFTRAGIRSRIGSLRV